MQHERKAAMTLSVSATNVHQQLFSYIQEKRLAPTLF